MAGVYIHIPFCKQKCHYCDFHFSTTFDAYYNRMIDAICKEIEDRAPYLEESKVETLYFGGGSPSLLSLEDILRIKKTVQEYLNCNIKEFTFECNPDDLSDGYIDELIEAGVDRLSIGIQSFDDEVLRFMNRAHNAEEALGCVQRAQRKGITNISIDLIYGVPKTNASYWEGTVAKALSLNVKHISAYCLTIEAGTVFSNWKKNEKFVSLPEEEELAQFNLLNQELSNVGIHRYEVSNFGKTGYESMHNSAYWSQVPYLGIGPSAHSFNKVSRQWNVSHNRKYMDGVINNESFFESEVLQKEDVFNECLLTGLRTVQGVSLNQLDSTLITSAWREKLKGLVKEGVLSLENGFIAIEEGHLFRADGIAADLFVE